MGMMVVSTAEIRALRAQRGQSQEEAARLVGASQLCWREWETGKKAMPACVWVVYQQGGLAAARALVALDAEHASRRWAPESRSAHSSDEGFSDNELDELFSALGDTPAPAPAPIVPKLTVKYTMGKLKRIQAALSKVIKEVEDEDED